MVYGDDRSDKTLIQEREQVSARLAQETQIRWPTLSAIAVIIVVGTVIVTYLGLGACIGRH
jgi:hypothetical protein